MSESQRLTFPSAQNSSFNTVLKSRVKGYFDHEQVSTHANAEMVGKTVIILMVYLVTYLLIVLNVFNPWALFALAGLHGFATALIGLNIAHDALHNAYSSNSTVNRLLGLLFNIIGANDYMWKLMHNVVHHTYTNIPGHDEDIDQIPILRMNPRQNKWYIHRFQHIYAGFLYGLSSISWVFLKDYKKFFATRIGSVERVHARKEMVRLFTYKAIYYLLFLVVPLIVIPLAWWQILIGFFFMHFIQGLTLSFVFQLGHVVDGPDFPEPDAEGQLENTWAIHQLRTSSNFAQKSTLARILCGGLNFQIEHHLFPNICHVHYHKIAPIV